MALRGLASGMIKGLCWLVILLAGAALVVSVLIPRVAGATPYTVLTGSMEPGMAPGTLVVVRPVAAPDIGSGDVITYQLRSGEPVFVTHRVVSVGTNLKGEQQIITQGDANEVPDELAVRSVQVMGEKWYSVPYLGHVNNILTGKERQMAVYVVAALLLGYGAFMGTSGARDRLQNRPASQGRPKVQAS
ncbi:MAG: signal peptidase I [Nocardioides sp.]|nr:signal peptidase I [Nocardioides sp.]